MSDTPKRLTQRQLDLWVKKWAAPLRLADWDISIEVCRFHEMGLPDALGTCETNIESRSALIQILDIRDWEEQAFGTDPERTVVHELVHLHFAPFRTKPDSTEEVYEEQAVHAIADA